MKDSKADLVRNHDRIERRLSRLIEALETDALLAELRAIWSGIETHLLDQMNLEERNVFPLLERERPAKVEQLRLEHQQLRHVLAKVGAGLELSTLTPAQVRDLSVLLGEHALREEESLHGVDGATRHSCA